jgi:annexin A7/11
MADEDKQKQQPPVDKQKLQERILRSVKPSMGDATSKWVVNLKQGVTDQVDVPTEFDENHAAQYPCDMRTWVDKMFDDFQRYQVEYNREQKDPNMIIESERPMFMQSSQSSMSHKYTTERGTAQHFQGHLYTRNWALLIRGETLSIRAWMLPVDFLLGFDSKDEEFTAYLEMKGATNQNGLIIWHIDAVPIPFEATAAISKALFSAMVRATKNEFDTKERFAIGSADLAIEVDTKELQRYTIPPGSAGHQFLLRPEDMPPPPPPRPGYGAPGYPGQMSYPQQGGYPPAGAPGYPPQGAPGYPPQGAPGYPPQSTPGYAPQSAPVYPPQGAQAYPPQSAPGYPPAGAPGYLPQGAPDYPPSGTPNYPPQGAPGYPPSGAPTYPPQSGPGYPPSGAPTYPLQSGPGYPPSGAPGYPPQSAPAYPSSGAQAYPGQGTEQQTHAANPVPPQNVPGPASQASRTEAPLAPAAPQPHSASARFENAPPTASGILKQIRPDLIDPNTGHGDLLRMSMDENLRQLLWACNSASQSFSAQLEVLSKIGTAASQVRNQKVVDLVSQRSAALTAFKEKLDSFAGQLNGSDGNS